MTFIEGTVTGPTGKRTTAEFLVDSGARYTLLPEASWKAIELSPKLSLLLMALALNVMFRSVTLRFHREKDTRQ